MILNVLYDSGGFYGNQLSMIYEDQRINALFHNTDG